MRPLNFRTTTNELETARRLVGRAERRALETAERLRRQAEEVLRAAESRVAAAERAARHLADSEVEQARQLAAQAERRASAAEGELDGARRELTRVEAQLENLTGRVPTAPGPGEEIVIMQGDSSKGAEQTEMEDFEQDRGNLSPEPPDSPPDLGQRGGAEQSAATGADEISRSLSELLQRVSEDSRLLTEAAGREGQRLRDEAHAELARARDQAAAALSGARAEADRLLKNAREEVERQRDAVNLARRELDGERESAARERAEAQRVLEEARDHSTRMVNQVQDECNRLLAAAKAAAEAEVGGIKREFRSHVLALRDALAVARDSLDRFVDTEAPTGPAGD